MVRQIPALTAESGVASWYRERAASQGALADSAELQANRIGYLRLLVFLGLLLALLWLATAAPELRLLAALATAVATIAFVFLVRAHRRAREASARHDAAREYHTLGERRVLRDWEALPPPPSAASEAELAATHPYASDLDVVGRVSLIQLLDVTSRAPGRSTLLGWLLESAPSAAEIRARQAAARELAGHDELREELGVLARMSRAVGPQTLERFVEWCESPPWLLGRPALLWSGRLLTAITVIAFILQAAGVLTWPLWVLTATLGLFLILGVRAGLAQALKVAGVPSEQLRHHAAMIRLLLDTGWESPRLRRIGQSLRSAGGERTGEGGEGDEGGVGVGAGVGDQGGASWRGDAGDAGDAAHALERLERIVAFAEVRHSPMLHLALQWLFVWDIHVAASLEAWRRIAGVHVRAWLEALGEAESLSALGTLAHDNPDWCFPVITDGVEGAGGGGNADRVGSVNVASVNVGSGANNVDGPKEAAEVEAGSLGHPLLPDRARVSNDVTVGPPGSFLLITGSNMSGKSTLLRAIGANVVLALAGAPVCAARFTTPLLGVRTSIRIQDSLERGISLFMAELQRLREIVDAARGAPQGRRVLYLLDEMLHGTNTAERQIAARIVIGHLIRAGAIGAVTTHDLSLASGGGLETAARPVHFSEQFQRADGRTVMTFDYRLRPGLATSANALALLELVGLSERE